MYNNSEFPSFERLEQINLFLSKVEQLTQANGKEWVEKILWLGGLISNSKDSQSIDVTSIDSIDSKQKLDRGIVLIDEVKELGIDIYKQVEEEQNISDLIQRSTYAQVKTAIAIYKDKFLNQNRVYDNKAEKLFFTILRNEHKT